MPYKDLERKRQWEQNIGTAKCKKESKNCFSRSTIGRNEDMRPNSRPELSKDSESDYRFNDLPVHYGRITCRLVLS